MVKSFIRYGLLALLALGAPRVVGANDALWGLLRAGGQVVVMRHASTDRSIGDPPNFRLDDCSTQRNRSDAGREEARRVGAAFLTRGIPTGRVLSSQWCRCLETARLAFGEQEPWPALNSAFGNRDLEPARTRVVRALVDRRLERGNLVLVTRQFNSAALTGVYPAAGQLVVLAPFANGDVPVTGRMKP